MRTSSLLYASSVAFSVVVACGGKIVGVGTGPSCVTVDPSTYNTSCNQDSDCIAIVRGELCTGSCGCEGAAVNASEEKRYVAAVSSITLGQCNCIAQGVPQCVQNSCALCNGPDAPAGCKGTVTVDDAGPPPPDAPTCVNVDLASYDRSCTQDSDCISVTAGEICTGSCSCGGSSINRSGEARYDALVNSIVTEGCPCPGNGPIRCALGQCTQCGFGPNEPAGCGDGG